MCIFNATKFEGECPLTLVRVHSRSSLDKYFKNATDVEGERAQRRKRTTFVRRQTKTFFNQGTEVEAIRLKSISTQTSRQFERAGVLFADCAAARLQPLRHWFALSCALPFWHQGNSHLVCNPHLPVSRFSYLLQEKGDCGRGIWLQQTKHLRH